MAKSWEEARRDNEAVTRHLTDAGVMSRYDTESEVNGSPTWQVESGHHVSVSQHPLTGEWHMSATHFGDPSGNSLISALGTHDPAEVPGQLTREFRHRETLGHMQDMWRRASDNNDPTGAHPEAQRYSRRLAHDPQWIRLDHYGLHPGQPGQPLA